MMPAPGAYCDLDALTNEAVANNLPNALVDDIYGDTTLLQAVAIRRRFDLAKRLFSIGSMMTADTFASTIGWGCGSGMAVLFLERGVPHNMECLEHAARRQDWDTACALLDYGANIETRVDGVSLLHLTVWLGTIDSCWAAHRLLDRGADVNCRDLNSLTPLMKACDSKNPVKWAHSNIKESMVNLLLERGADVNAQSAFGETPLLLCVSEKNNYPSARRIKTVRKLLKAGANPNTLSPQGTTALMFAARDDDDVLAHALLNAGADAAIRTPDGRTARDIAKQHDSKKVVALLPQKISLRNGDG